MVAHESQKSYKRRFKTTKKPPQSLKTGWGGGGVFGKKVSLITTSQLRSFSCFPSDSTDI
jgi:hypothetical protein